MESIVAYVEDLPLGKSDGTWAIAEILDQGKALQSCLLEASFSCSTEETKIASLTPS